MYTHSWGTMHMWNMYVCIVYTLHCKAGVVYKQTGLYVVLGLGFLCTRTRSLLLQCRVVWVSPFLWLEAILFHKPGTL